MWFESFGELKVEDIMSNTTTLVKGKCVLDLLSQKLLLITLHCFAFNMMGPMFKVRLVLFIMCLDQPGFPLCWKAVLICFTWVMVVLI
jgi:hypothetical protein